jgi:phenylacetate-coenzyme A ligase PaaK-like adenylate-forming protein
VVALRRALAARSEVDRLDGPDRAAWQATRLAALRAHAVARSPFYAERHRELEAAPLEALPVVTKVDVVERFDELVTDRALRTEHLRSVVEGGDATARALGCYRVGASSGSSGRPGLFPFDAAEWVGLLANAARARAIPGPVEASGRVRSAKVGSPSPWHLSHQVAATLSDPRRPTLALSAAEDLGDLLEALQAWRPAVLTGYPSVLGALAGAQAAGDLQIEPVRVYSGGEPLTPATRAAITAAWGVPPFDQYLTTEAGFVAIECPAHDGLHVLDDHVVVEVVDEHGAPAATGDAGTRVLLTVRGSRTLPLIRYELTDAATLAVGPCACGRRSPRLASVAGPARQLLRLSDGAGGEVTVHPVAVTAVLDAAPVQAWQVVLEPRRTRVLVVRPAASFDPEAVGAALRDALAATGAAVPPVEVEVVPVVERGSSGQAAHGVTRPVRR